MDLNLHQKLLVHKQVIQTHRNLNFSFTAAESHVALFLITKIKLFLNIHHVHWLNQTFFPLRMYWWMRKVFCYFGLQTSRLKFFCYFFFIVFVCHRAHKRLKCLHKIVGLKKAVNNCKTINSFITSSQTIHVC